MQTRQKTNKQRKIYSKLYFNLSFIPANYVAKNLYCVRQQAAASTIKMHRILRKKFNLESKVPARDEKFFLLRLNAYYARLS